MTADKIERLLSQCVFPEPTKQTELVETHISWVILCDRFVYKIKKPINYSFLDFSTLEKRKFYCEKELELNQRFSENIYLNVLPIYQLRNHFQIGGTKGKLLDYALRMRRLDSNRQMDILLSKDGVRESDVKNLAERIVEFHKNALIIKEKDITAIRDEFKDLNSQKRYLMRHLDIDAANIISRAVDFSDTFLQKNESLLKERLSVGFVRDCHGDLHTRNIFLLPDPQPFDCIEFSDEFRQIDVLNEVAFLCMDLDALGRKDLSALFIKHYNHLFPVIRNDSEKELFNYYKSYRANVRAKVHALRARSETDDAEKVNALAGAGKYLKLMDFYVRSLTNT